MLKFSEVTVGFGGVLVRGRRVKLHFIPRLEVEFIDRVRGIKQVYEFAEKSTRFPVVVFGPEGCGKTAWLKQATEVLRELGFDVVYVDPLHRGFIVQTDVSDIVRKFSEVVADVTGVAELKLATLAIDSIKELLSRWRRRKVAILVDDVFQAIGLDKAETYVKSLLNLIEYPPESYEGIVVIVATSEGVSRVRIGRHLWALIRPIWNMCKEGFKELYERIPEPKPDFEDVWGLTGGNPRILSQLYQVRWGVDVVVRDIIRVKNLTKDFIRMWGTYLRDVVEDPDNLWEEEVPKEFREELIERNLVVYNMYDRDYVFWIDEPPPQKDLEIGIGRYVAWQTPLHREAVRRALEEL